LQELETVDSAVYVFIAICVPAYIGKYGNSYWQFGYAEFTDDNSCVFEGFVTDDAQTTSTEIL